MLKFAKLAAVTTLAVLLAAPALADDTAATVNGVAIPQSRVDMEVQELVQRGQTDSPDLRKAVLERIINFELLAQKAVKDGFDKQPNVEQKLVLARQQVLIQALIEDYKKNHPVSEDAVKAAYDKIKNQPQNMQYRFAHIMVTSERKAQMIEARLKKGANFKALARKYSEDPTARKNGGEMGWHNPSEFPPDFASVMIQLQKGQVSVPLQAQGSWHIIKMEEVKTIPFADAKGVLLQQLQAQGIQKMLNDLHKNAKIEGVSK